MYFSQYCRVTGAAPGNIAINQQIPRIDLLSVRSYLRTPAGTTSFCPSKDERDDRLIPSANADILVALKVMLMHLRAIRRRRIL